jgi:DNA gyrase subunit A
MAIRFHESDVRAMGRTARGVKALSLRDGDCVVGMSVLRAGGLVLTVSETGCGRLSQIDDYRVQQRGGKGLLNYHVERYGAVAAIKVVDLNDDVIIISSDGIIIRFQAETIRLCARPSKGVLLMRLTEDSKVVTVARTAHDDEEETEVPVDDGSADEGAGEDTAPEEDSAGSDEPTD